MKFKNNYLIKNGNTKHNITYLGLNYYHFSSIFYKFFTKNAYKRTRTKIWNFALFFKKFMKAKNKILLKIEQKEEKRKEKVEKTWNSLTDEDFDYIDTGF